MSKFDVRKSANAFGYGTDLNANGNANVITGDYGVRANHLFNEKRISESHIIWNSCVLLYLTRLRMVY